MSIPGRARLPRSKILFKTFLLSPGNLEPHLEPLHSTISLTVPRPSMYRCILLPTKFLFPKKYCLSPCSHVYFSSQNFSFSQFLSSLIRIDSLPCSYVYFSPQNFSFSQFLSSLTHIEIVSWTSTQNCFAPYPFLQHAGSVYFFPPFFPFP